MTLIQTGHLIANAKCNQNFFVLELTIFNKAIQITGRSQPTYLVSKNKKVKM